MTKSSTHSLIWNVLSVIQSKDTTIRIKFSRVPPKKTNDSLFLNLIERAWFV